MAHRVLKVWYIKEADILEVFWGEEGAPMMGTEHDRVLVQLDVEGNLQGFQIHGVTRLGDDLVKVSIPSPTRVK